MDFHRENDFENVFEKKGKEDIKIPAVFNYLYSYCKSLYCINVYNWKRIIIQFSNNINFQCFCLDNEKHLKNKRKCHCLIL